MSGWEDLVTTALLGTERRALPATLPVPVARLSAAKRDAGLAVLDAAAGYTSYRVAGARPAGCPAPQPAPRQVRDLAPERAQTLLARLLRARDVGLVEEWLTECAARGLGVRAALWVPLATAAVTAGGPDRGLVRTTVGGRGVAFFGLNPAWRRLARTADPVPRRAEQPLPAWSAERTEQALAAVRVTRSPGRRAVHVTTPPGGAGLRDTVAGADLDVWQRHTGLAPAPLVALLRAHAPDRAEELVDGLRAAAVAQAHRGWATALVAAGHVSADLAELVPGPDLGRAAQSWVAGGLSAAEAARSLGVLPGPWSVEVTGAALRLLGGRDLDSRTARRLSLHLARRAPLTAHAEVLGLAGPEHALVDAAEVMSLRLQIRRSFGTATAGHASETPPTEETS